MTESPFLDSPTRFLAQQRLVESQIAAQPQIVLMADPDLTAWIEEHYPSESTLALNEIIPLEQQQAIQAAAYAAHRGDDHEAEKFRREAGYGGL